MKKYRITSIPQSLPKAQTGESIDDRNRLKMQKKLKMKTQKYGSKQKDSDPNYGKTYYKGPNLKQNFADAFYNSIYNDKNPYPNFYKFDTDEMMRRLINLRSNDIQEQAYQEYEKQENERIDNYLKDVSKSKKSDKIKPLYENKTLTQEQVNELRNEGNYYIQKNNNGAYSVWPYQVLQNKIINNGFKDRDFVNKWGLDGEQVREQMGELIDWREEYYDNSMMNKILTTALEENKTPKQVINELSPKDGVTKDMQSHFKELVSKRIEDVYDYNTNEILSNYDKTEKDRVKWDREKDFDFGRVSGTENIDGKEIWKIAVDADKKYQDWWVDQGKTPTEKKIRREKLNRVLEGNYTPSKEFQDEAEITNSFVTNQRKFAEKTYREGQENAQNVGYDAFSDMDYNRIYSNLPSFNIEDLKNKDKEKFSLYKEKELQKLTEEDIAEANYMRDNMDIPRQERKLIEQAYSNPALSLEDKISILNSNVTKDGKSVFDFYAPRKESVEKEYEDLLKQKEVAKKQTGIIEKGKSLEDWVDKKIAKNLETLPVTYMDKINNLYNLRQHRYDLDRNSLKAGPDKLDVMDPKTGKVTKGDPEISFATKAWDVITNPGQAIGYAMDLRPNATMWKPGQTQSFNELQEQARNSGFENEQGEIIMNEGLRDKDLSGNAPAMMASLYNKLNPLHWGDELSRDFSLDRTSDLGMDAAAAYATLYSGGQGGLGKYAKNWMANEWKYAAPFYAYEAFKPDGYLAKGDYLSAAFAAPIVGKYAKNALPIAKGIGQSLKHGKLATINPKINYSFTAANPSTGKGFFYGNPASLEKGFSKSYFPKTRDKIFDKTGYGIDFRKKIDPPGYKFGGELPKAQLGKWIKYLGKSKNYLKNFIKGKPIPEFGGRRYNELSDIEKKALVDKAMLKLNPKDELNISQIEKKPRTIKIADDLKWAKRDQISDIGGFELGPAQGTIQNIINQKGIKNLDELDKMLAKTFNLEKGSLLTNSLTKRKGLGIDDFDFKPMSPGAIEMNIAKLLAADVKGPNFARSTNFPTPMNDEHAKLFYNYNSAPPEEMRNLIRKGMIKKFGPDKVLKYDVNNLEEHGRLGPQGMYGRFTPLKKWKLDHDMSNLPSMKGESSPILNDNYRLNTLVNQYDSFIKMGIDPNKPGMLSLQDKIKNFPRKDYNQSNEWMKFSGKDVNLRDPLIMNQEGGQLPKAKLGKWMKYANNYFKPKPISVIKPIVGIKPTLTFKGPKKIEWGDGTNIDKSLKGLRERGKSWDDLGATGDELLHPDLVEYHGTYDGRPIVEVKMPDGSSEMFYKSSGWAGKLGEGVDGTTEGMWQVYGGHADRPKRAKNWFIKDAGYKDYYGSNAFKEMANNLDNILSKKYDVPKSDLNHLLNFKGIQSSIDSYTPGDVSKQLTEITKSDDFIQFSKSPSKEKDGGIVVSLSQKEIDQYAKEGWIIEDV